MPTLRGALPACASGGLSPTADPSEETAPTRAQAPKGRPRAPPRSAPPSRGGHLPVQPGRSGTTQTPNSESSQPSKPDQCGGLKLALRGGSKVTQGQPSAVRRFTSQPETRSRSTAALIASVSGTGQWATRLRALCSSVAMRPYAAVEGGTPQASAIVEISSQSPGVTIK